MKTIKRDKEVERVFGSGEVMVMLEKMNYNIMVLAENVSGINERLDKMEASINQRID